MLLSSAQASAESDQTKDWTLNLYLDNDLFSQTDRDYTNGLRVSWVSPDITSYLDDPTLPAWIRAVNQKLTFFHDGREGLQRNLIFSVGQTLYTPGDLTRTDLIVDDRPYAGWLFASVGYQTRKDDQLDTLEARFGIVGPGAFGKEAQDFVHDIRGFDKFQGWDNQLENEPGVIFLWEHKRKYRYLQNENSRFGYDVIGHTGLALGNVRSYLNGGAEFRVGWAIPDDFGTSALRPGGDNSSPYSTWDPRSTVDRIWGAHGFISFDMRLVGQDIFLDGNTFRDSHSIAKESLVVDGAIGFSIIYGRTKMSYAQIFRTREYSSQVKGHSYGSIAVSYTFR